MATAGAVTAPVTRWRFWLGVAAGFLLLLWLLNDILLPFVVGAAVAYFFDPVVTRLQRAGLSRTWATAVVTIVAVLIAAGAAMAIVPPLFGQVQALIGKAPEYTVKAAQRVQPMIEPVREKLGLPPLSLQELQAEATQWAGQALALRGQRRRRVAQRGVAIINLLGLLFLTPVVTFYLLRDWPKVLAAIDGALPLDNAADHPLASRTRPTPPSRAICAARRWSASASATLYGVGLSLVGLQFGFVIGLIAGLISFIPFVGTLVGATLSIGMALAQFPPDWFGVAKVAAVFLVGHLLEGNVLSPKLVGDRVGLHPVWIMFALLAGGSLFGFVGVLIAVPVAAVDRRGGAPPAGPLPREQLLSRRRVRLIAMVKQLTLDLALPPPTYARDDFVRVGRQSRGAGLDRPLARLAGAGAGAERPGRAAARPISAASGRRRPRRSCSTAPTSTARTSPISRRSAEAQRRAADRPCRTRRPSARCSISTI